MKYTLKHHAYTSISIPHLNMMVRRYNNKQQSFTFLPRPTQNTTALKAILV